MSKQTESFHGDTQEDVLFTEQGLVSKGRLKTILDAVDTMVYIKDSQRRYIYVNRCFSEFLGRPASEILMRRDEELIDDRELLELLELIERTDHQVLGSGPRSNVQIQLPSSMSGMNRSYQVTKMPLSDASGRVEAICTFFVDTTDKVLAEEQARYLTYYDALTNLPNRSGLVRHIGRCLKDIRDGEAFGAVLVLNLDNFKVINDAQGYAMGDRVLKEVARRLVVAVRERDLVARIRGDEYAVLLTGLGSGMEDSGLNAIRVADKLLHTLTAEPVELDGMPGVLGVSIGQTLLHPDNTDPEAVLHEAELAMHRAKKLGGNRAEFFRREIQSEVEQRLWLEQELVRALHTPRLQMHIQPQYDAMGNVAGAELLTRWFHEERGLIAPSRFIALAEESSLIRRLTDWTMEVVCDVLLQLDRHNADYPVSINISPRCLLEPCFTHAVQKILQRTQAPANRLVFEITEDALLLDRPSVMDNINRLHEVGLRFSVDDFGTGYSNLSKLKRLPLYEIKIDRSLVQDLPDDPDSVVIDRLVLSMARQLGLRVVAEGVETRRQAEFLLQHGCDALQGYWMASPMPFEQWLAMPDGGRLPALYPS